MKKRSIELRGFGTFFIKEIKEKYSARNPKTGASKQFKEFLNKWKNQKYL